MNDDREHNQLHHQKYDTPGISRVIAVQMQHVLLVLLRSLRCLLLQLLCFLSATTTVQRNTADFSMLAAATAAVAVALRAPDILTTQQPQQQEQDW